MMLVLFEIAGGFAVFKLLKQEILGKSEKWFEEFMTIEMAKEILKLKHVEKYETIDEALDSAIRAMESNVPLKIEEYLKRVFSEEKHQCLVVGDEKIGKAISSKLGIKCIDDSSAIELQRFIRNNMDSIFGEKFSKELTSMTLGVVHGLSRYKIKVRKLDKLMAETMVSIDELDKSLNNYIMRCKEWYGWHFPELSSVVSDSILYVKTALAIGDRKNIAGTNLSSILTKDIEAQVKILAQMSIGTDIAEEDFLQIKTLCEDVLQMQQERTKHFEYLKRRMSVIAPNITILVGEVAAARLLAQAGSLEELARYPASALQTLGTEKNTQVKKETRGPPKYGIIYHTQLVGQSPTGFKCKMSRMLAGKTSLASRIDTYGEETAEFGVEYRKTLDSILKRKVEHNIKKEPEKKEDEWTTVSAKKSQSKKSVAARGEKCQRRM